MINSLLLPFGSPEDAREYAFSVLSRKDSPQWIFMSDKNILFLMMDMPIVRKGRMALDKNPFLDPGYFEHRAKKHRLDRKKAICSNRAAQIGYYAL